MKVLMVNNLHDFEQLKTVISNLFSFYDHYKKTGGNDELKEQVYEDLRHEIETLSSFGLILDFYEVNQEEG